MHLLEHLVLKIRICKFPAYVNRRKLLILLKGFADNTLHFLDTFGHDVKLQLFSCFQVRNFVCPNSRVTPDGTL